MGRNNNNAGMHFIWFASERTALDEYDFDNALAQRIYASEKHEDIKQTGCWTFAGKPRPIIRCARKKYKEISGEMQQIVDGSKHVRVRMGYLVNMEQPCRNALKTACTLSALR